MYADNDDDDNSDEDVEWIPAMDSEAWTEDERIQNQHNEYLNRWLIKQCREKWREVVQELEKVEKAKAHFELQKDVFRHESVELQYKHKLKKLFSEVTNQCKDLQEKLAYFSPKNMKKRIKTREPQMHN